MESQKNKQEKFLEERWSCSDGFIGEQLASLDDWLWLARSDPK